MERKVFQISEEDWNELMRLSKIARETPVITLSVEQGLKGQDFARTAHQRVDDKWIELGKEYGFDGGDIVSEDESQRKISAYPLKENDNEA